MYRYDEFDHAFVADRIAEFSDQVARRIDGTLSEDQFKPLRLMNGLYLQLHAYMLRVAVPYGVISATQMRKLAHIARTYDRDFGHFTTRQNIQFNWIKLKDVPDILRELASVEMHALQTSGNCIRNVTTDAFAGAALDEVDDPRIWAEVLRQWSSIHPEFTYLPRKFKIAITGATRDRAAIRAHDIGLHLKEGGFDVYVGGGLGRTPHLGSLIKSGLPREKLVSYLEAILRVYNRYGRRDNAYKARIKILVSALGIEEFSRQAEEEWTKINHAKTDVPATEVARIAAHFKNPDFVNAETDGFEKAKIADQAFARWVRHNTHAHKRDDHLSVIISTKSVGGAPGDASSAQIDIMADVADSFGYGQLRIAHNQNVVLPHVSKSDLYELYQALQKVDLATPNAGLITDQICCPGLDYCTLANARSIPLAQEISTRFSDPVRAEDIGELDIKMSGCINACGHHHIGHIGILGVDKQGIEYYQILLGGRADEKAAIGIITGKGLPAEAVPAAIERVVDLYLKLRLDATERFVDVVERLGRETFAEVIHADA